MPRMRILVLAVSMVISSAAAADVMHLATEGVGEALIYPYYTARNGTLSLLSVVNVTDAPKAVRVRFRESIAGRNVGEFNLFLSAKDVWTGAIVASGQGTAIVTNDRSCTTPKITSTASSFTLSELGYSSDAAIVGTAVQDRTREGFIELIEMASLGSASALGRDVTHVSGTPTCRLSLSMDNPEAIAASLRAPSGGLMGSMSFINLADGVGVSYNATAIAKFWSTAPDKPPTAITMPQQPTALNVRSEPDLASGGNNVVSLQDGGSTYLATFARSIDALSALFMASTFHSEYGFTSDSTFANTFVFSMPTKPYYIHTTDTVMFEGRYSPVDTQSCDTVAMTSNDREEFVFAGDVESPSPPRPPGWRPCDVVNSAAPGTLGGPLTGTGTAFNSPRTKPISVVQNAGLPVVSPGKEGGHFVIYPANPQARLTSTKATVVKRSSSGAIETTSAKITLYGLPIIGYALSAAKYNAGSPQQNFGNLNPINTRRNIVVGAN